MLHENIDQSIRAIKKRQRDLMNRILSSADRHERTCLFKELQKVDDMLLAFDLSLINIKIYCLENTSQEKPSFYERLCRFFWMFMKTAGF